MMKHYVFLQLIHGSGGVQCYLAAKTKWLEENGWHVVVISNCNPKTKKQCLIGALNRFIHYGNVFTGVHPSELPVFIVRKHLKDMMTSIGIVRPGEEVIVESWNSETALWGELLASRLHGRHVFWMANENFRQPGQKYEEKIAFYKFKMDRGEIFLGFPAVNLLFEGYYTYKESDYIPFAMTEDPIQDVYNEEVDSIKKAGWNICYVGRDNKPYVPNVIQGVTEFAKKHVEKQIQFIIVGEVTDQRLLLDSIKLPNLSIIELGNLYPLPRQLYSKVDVVIAGSGSARHSADEGALVVTTDTITLQSHGLLGYDTQSSIYTDCNEPDISFADALERALVTQEWRTKENAWVKTPGIADSMAIQERILSRASPTLEYYDENNLLAGKVNWKKFIRTSIYDFIGQ